MSGIVVRQILAGLYWVEIPAIGLRLQCGCPPDANKYLRAAGFIRAEAQGETGPNAILLADVTTNPLTQGWFPVNAAEFSVMQMLYLQGLIVPNHPNNTGRKPMLIGAAQEMNRQMNYIYFGNYGLDSPEELLAAGMSAEEAEAFWYAKKKFAFGTLHPITHLIEPVCLEGNSPIALANGCQIERLRPNYFRISHAGESVEIHLQPQIFPPSYQLPQVSMPKAVAFGILHIGEGDGWDENRPCMGSALTFHDTHYLIDAGPHVLHNWQQTGKTLGDIQAVFLTHAHDDHAIGLIQAISKGIRLPVYCGSVIKAAFVKKMSALMGIRAEEMERFFEFRLLDMQRWNPIATVNGATLEAMPCYSLHPIETHIYYFRYTDARGAVKIYGHLADILSEKGLQAMETDAPEQVRWLFDHIRANYYMPADWKKIDIGGGATHGMAEDFIQDSTPVKIWAHVHRPLSAAELQIGCARSFGDWDGYQV
jgi:hemerythrin